MFTGHQLREYRQKRGWTQKQLGEQTYMSRDAIARIEADNRVIDSFEQLKSFQMALRIPFHVIGFIPIEVEGHKHAIHNRDSPARGQAAVRNNTV